MNALICRFQCADLPQIAHRTYGVGVQEENDWADLIPFGCSECERILAVDDSAGPPGWELRRGWWVCDTCLAQGLPIGGAGGRIRAMLRSLFRDPNR